MGISRHFPDGATRMALRHAMFAKFLCSSTWEKQVLTTHVFDA